MPTSFVQVENVILDGVRASGYTGSALTVNKVCTRNVKLMGFGGAPLQGTGHHHVNMEITDCSVVNAFAGSSATFEGGNFHDNAAGVFSFSTGSAEILNSIFDTNAGPGILITGASIQSSIKNNVFYNQTGTNPGISITAACQVHIAGNIFESNSTYGVNLGAVCPRLYMDNNAYYGNSSGTYQAANVPVRNVYGDITITAGSVFVDAPNSDFRLNPLAGRGALLFGTGFSQTLPGISFSNSMNVGAWQGNGVERMRQGPFSRMV